ncbi:MAG: DUF2157 domain-containing protein [Alphaproteobacteria bacterium]|nr:DUF2157 domain-containing protein [Alphaproteobacteria bacterium]
MNKGLAILMMLAFWVCFFWLIFKAIKSGNKAKNLQGVLLLKRKITEEQYQKITDFEKKEKIKKWQKAGLISQTQADEILNPKPKHLISIASSLLYLGVGCIVLGVIALIAANYDKIPPMVRLLTTFSAFIGCNLGVYYAYSQKKSLALEGFIIASIGLIGALIGLISQTFHLDGNVGNALFIWTVLALPFIILSDKKWWTMTWYTWFTFTFLGSEYGEMVIDKLSDIFTLPTCFISLLFLVATVYDCLRKAFPNRLFTEGLKIWGSVYAFAAIILTDSVLVESSSWYHSYDASKMLLSAVSKWPLNLILLSVSAAYPLYKLVKNNLLRYYFWFLFVFGLVVSICPLPFMGIVLSLTSITFLAIYFALKNQIRYFNWMIVAFFVRILFAYFNLFMSLVSTGFGAIVLGALILLGVKFWMSYNEKLINYIQKGK